MVEHADQTALWSIANQLADAARTETLSLFRQRSAQATQSKLETFDPVTIADRNAEAAMRAIVEKLRPDDGILGEEFGNKPSKSGLTWVFDPIDGTRGYISGTPTWGVLIALAKDGYPVLGVIDQPYIQERFSGGLGRAQVAGPMGTSQLAVSTVKSLEEATLFTTFPEVGTEQEGEAFRRVASKVKLTRYGCDCYAYALLAAGQIDLVIEAGLFPYDIQAPIAVVEAAGGVVTDWNGEPVHEGGRAVAAATPELHQAALSILNKS